MKGWNIVRAAVAVLVLLVVGLLGSASVALAAPPPHEPFEVDCGIVTCTVRTDRETTRKYAEGGAGAAVFQVAVCGPLGLAAAVPGVACAALAEAVNVALKEHGRIAAARGDCVGFRIVPVPVVPPPLPVVLPAPVPLFVKGGTFNCV